MALSPSDLGQNWLSVSAAAEGSQKRTEAVMCKKCRSKKVDGRRQQQKGGSSEKRGGQN